jgi:hypothetical protein
MPEKKTTLIIFALLLIFYAMPPAFAVENLTILYTGDTEGRIIPVFQ